MNQNHQPSFCRQSKNAWAQELQFSEDWFNSPRPWHQHTPVQTNITGTRMPEDAKCQNTSPTFGSCTTAPIFHLPEVGSGLEAAGTPRPAQPSHTGEYGKQRLGGSQRIKFNCNPRFAGLVPRFESQPLILQTPEPQLCPKEGQPWQDGVL